MTGRNVVQAMAQRHADRVEAAQAAQQAKPKVGWHASVAFNLKTSHSSPKYKYNLYRVII